MAIICAASGTRTQNLRQWAQAGSVEDVKVWKDDIGTWLRLSKPPLEGVDEWTHWEHGPDNNPVSTDKVIKAPYMTQFLAEPFYIGMPAITTRQGQTDMDCQIVPLAQTDWIRLGYLQARSKSKTIWQTYAIVLTILFVALMLASLWLFTQWRFLTTSLF